MEKNIQKGAEVEKLGDEIKKKIMISDVTALSLEENELYLLGEVCLRMKIPVPVLAQWIGDSWENRISIKIEKGNNVERMRRWDVIE